MTTESPENYAKFISEQVRQVAKIGKSMVVLFTSNDSLALTAQALEAAEVDFLQADVSEDASRIKKNLMNVIRPFS